MTYLQTMPDWWHKQVHDRINKEHRKEREIEVLSRRRVSKLKGKLFKEIPIFSEKSLINNFPSHNERKLTMKSDLHDFRALLIQEEDANLAWKYNRLVNGFLGVDYGKSLKECSSDYVIRFW